MGAGGIAPGNQWVKAVTSKGGNHVSDKIRQIKGTFLELEYEYMVKEE